MLNSKIKRVLKLIEHHYDPKLVETWISIIEKSEVSCPCYEAGFILSTKHKPSIPKNECPLDLFKGNVTYCVSCEFSCLWNFISHHRKEYYKSLLEELKKIQKNN